MRVASIPPLLLTALLLASCSDLQPIEPNTCGNRIVDAGEACDEGGETDLCTAECRLICLDATGALPPGYVDNPEDAFPGGYCPLGQACGIDSLCAEPSGKFRAATSFELDVAQAEAGDVDGDGVADLVSTSATELRVLYGDSDGTPLTSESLQPSPSATGPFLLTDFNQSGGADLAIPTDGGVVPFFDVDGLLRHHPSPTLQIPREGNVAALDGLVTEAGGPRRAALVYLEEQGTAVVLRDLVTPGNPELARCETGGPVAAALRRGLLPVAPSTAGGLLVGDLLAAGIDRAVDPGLCVFAPANPTAPGDPGWTPRFIKLVSGARFDNDLTVPVLWANLDGDACPELLAPTLSGAAVPGYTLVDSTSGCSFATASATAPSWGPAVKALGAGNLDRVGPDELVTAAAVYRIDSPSAVTRLGPPVGMDRLRVADFNGDGLLDVAGVDVVAAGETSREAVRLLRTAGPAGSWSAVTAIVETLRPVSQISLGDFDGDRVADLALTEVIELNSQRTPSKMAVSVIYGQRSEIPQYRVLLELDEPAVVATLGPRRGAAAEQDAADDLGVAYLGDAASKVSASVLFGSAQRSLTAPLARTTGAAVAAVAAGPWANSDALLDLVVYADTSQYLWPQIADGFSTTASGTPSPIDARGLRDFAIASAHTTSGGSTVVSVTPSQQSAAIGGVGACATSWTGSAVEMAGPRPTLQVRNLDGLPGDEILVTSQPGANTRTIYAYPAIGDDCKLGAPLFGNGHPLLGCEAATIIEASATTASTSEAAGRRELLAVCRPAGAPDSQLIRFDFTGNGYAPAPQPVRLPGRARRLMVGDFTGDGLEDALSITTVGSVDFATLLVQCARTETSCE